MLQKHGATPDISIIGWQQPVHQRSPAIKDTVKEEKHWLSLDSRNIEQIHTLRTKTSIGRVQFDAMASGAGNESTILEWHDASISATVFNETRQSGEWGIEIRMTDRQEL